jgi:hypothetical protein
MVFEGPRCGKTEEGSGKKGSDFSRFPSKKARVLSSTRLMKICAVALRRILIAVTNPQDFDVLPIHAIDSDIG